MLLLGSSVPFLNIYTNYLLLPLNGNILFIMRDSLGDRVNVTSGSQNTPFPQLQLLSDHGQSLNLPEPWSPTRNIRTLIPLRTTATTDDLLGALIVQTAMTLHIPPKF